MATTNSFVFQTQSNIVFKEDKTVISESIDSTFDRDWIKTTFLISDTNLQNDNLYKKWILKNRYRSTADTKFTTTGIGMNMSVNPRPQFTRYCDIRAKGKIPSRPDVTTTSKPGQFGFGMGRYYSEAIDDPSQRIFLRFGVPHYTFLTAWFSNVFDPKRAMYANRGVISQFILDIADVVSSVLAIARAPMLSLGMLAFNLLDIFMNNSSSRFYSVRPTMHTYWLSVEDILNNILAKRTLLPNILPEYVVKISSTLGAAKVVTDAWVAELHTQLPDIFDKNGRISIFGLALKSQRAFNQMWAKDYEDNKKNPLSKNFLDYPITSDAKSHDTYFTYSNGQPNVASQLFNWAHKLLVDTNQDKAVDPHDGNSIKNAVMYDPRYVDAQGNFIKGNNEQKPDETMDDRVASNVDSQNNGKASKFSKIKEYFLAEMTEGAAFAVFTVESTGSIGESFSNSVQENPIQGTLNGLSAKSRSMQSVMSGITEIPIIGEVAKLGADVVGIVASNASYGMLNPILALLYGVNVLLPKVWEGSTTSFPKSDYKIKCISPYGNAISQLINTYLPMAMLMAGSLPRGTGSQSYTSPFICQVYDRGRTQITLGIISSLSITRGTSNLPFNRKGFANAIDIDFSIENLDSVMFAPIAEGGFVDTVKKLLKPLKEDNTFNDYITSIAGLDVMTQVYGVPKLRLQLATTWLKLGRYTDPDPAYFGSLAAGVVNSIFLGAPAAILGNNSNLVSNATNGGGG